MHSTSGPVHALCVVVGAALLASGCGSDPAEPSAESAPAATSLWPEPLADLDPDEPAQWTVAVVAQRPHDPTAFTQGLELLDDGRMIESVGLYGQSDVRIVDTTTGVVETRRSLAAEHFGEGVTVVDNTAIQLTWRAGVAYRWALPSLDALPALRYDGEGWGICEFNDPDTAGTDDSAAVVVTSNGTATLTWRNAETFEPIRTAVVVAQGAAVNQINELECVDGHILANVWQSDQILVIRDDGFVVAEIDGSTLVDATESIDDDPDVLNGIAVASETSFWMTGKLWSTLYEVELNGS